MGFPLARTTLEDQPLLGGCAGYCNGCKRGLYIYRQLAFALIDTTSSSPCLFCGTTSQPRDTLKGMFQPLLLYLLYSNS